MDAISYSYADKQAKRIKKFIENPDSASGILTQPSVIQTGETVTIPIGRTAIMANTQVDGTLVIDGDVFIPSGATFNDLEAQIASKVSKVTSTDNTIVRFNGTTGDVQNSSVDIDDAGTLRTLGNIQAGSFDGGNSFTYIQKQTIQSVDPVFQSFVNGVVTSQIQSDGAYINKGVSAFGYGTGAGGSVTQLTSKGTSVTLNKPAGRIITASDALAAGATVSFILNNALLNVGDVIHIENGTSSINYSIRGNASNGTARIVIKNESAGSLSQAIDIYFIIIKGATA